MSAYHSFSTGVKVRCQNWMVTASAAPPPPASVVVPEVGCASPPSGAGSLGTPEPQAARVAMAASPALAPRRLRRVMLVVMCCS